MQPIRCSKTMQLIRLRNVERLWRFLFFLTYFSSLNFISSLIYKIQYIFEILQANLKSWFKTKRGKTAGVTMTMNNTLARNDTPASLIIRLVEPTYMFKISLVLYLLKYYFTTQNSIFTGRKMIYSEVRWYIVNIYVSSIKYHILH